MIISWSKVGMGSSQSSIKNSQDIKEGFHVMMVIKMEYKNRMKI